MNQKDLDKLRNGIDPEYQHLIGDVDELEIDGHSDEPILQRLTEICSTPSVTKASVEEEFGDILGSPVDLALGIDGEEPAGAMSQADFLKSASPAFVIPPPGEVSTGGTLVPDADLGEGLGLCAATKMVDGRKMACSLPLEHEGEHDFSIVLPVKEKSQEYREAQDKFITVSRWLKDRLNKMATPEERLTGVVQKIWRATFGFSSDRLNNDRQAREAVDEMVTDMASRLIMDEPASHSLADVG
jgi:hypothetical protein